MIRAVKNGMVSPENMGQDVGVSSPPAWRAVSTPGAGTIWWGWWSIAP